MVRSFTRTATYVVVAGSLVAGVLGAAPAAQAERPVPAERAGFVVSWGPDETPAIPPGNDFRAVAIGTRMTYGLKGDGTLVGVGTNTNLAGYLPPALTGKTVTSITTNGNVAAAITSEKNLVVWGAAGRGNVTTVPAAAAGRTVDVDLNSNFAIAALDDGTLIGWGTSAANANGVHQPPALTGIVDVEVGSSHALARTADGRVHGWGLDVDGEATPPAELTGKNVVDVVPASRVSVALTDQGEVIQWGRLGVGTYVEPFPAASVDGKVVDIVNVNGSNFFGALTDRGEVVFWGDTELAGRPPYAAVPASLAGAPVAAISGDHNFAVLVTHVAALEATARPTIAGAPAYLGRTLTGTPATFAGNPETVTSRWLADGAEVGTGPTLTLGEALRGKSVTFESKATRGEETVTSTSDPVGPVADQPTTVASTTTVAVAPASAAYGTGRTVTVSVAKAGGTPSGSVAVSVGGTSSTVALAAGKATLTVPATLAVGTHPVSASYAGDATTNASAGSASVVVTKAASRSKVAAVAVKKKGKKVTVQVKVTGPVGANASGKVAIVIKRGAKTVAKKTVNANAAGVATFTAKKLTKKGKYKVTASYGGSTTLVASKATKAFKV